MIPYGRQEVTQEDIDAVTDVLHSDFLTQGPKVPLFEDVVSKYCNASYAVSTNSATSALHLACLALNLSHGDWLWTTPITFVASANCGLYCGAQVDFVDIDPKTYNMSIESLKHKLFEAEIHGKLPKVVIPVHFGGQSCDMKAIHALSKQYGFRVIEDASHAIGGKYKNANIGNCKYSDITVFSFHPVKIITTCEGGMAMTNNHKLSSKMRRLCSHGITRDSNEMTHLSHGPWYYQQIDLGFNYRMNDIQAALGISQMNRIDSYIKKRQSIAAHYNKELSELPLTTPHQHAENFSAYHLYVVRLKCKLLKKNHAQIFKSLRDEGIGVNLHYIPIHTQPYYKNLGFNEGNFPNAEQYYKEAISLPIYPTLDKYQQNSVIDCIKKLLK